MCVTGKGVRTVPEDSSGNLVLAPCTALLYSLKAPTHLLLLRQILLPVLESPPPPSKPPYPRLTSPSVKPSSLSSISPPSPSKPSCPRLTTPSLKTSLSSTHHTLRQNLLFVLLARPYHSGSSLNGKVGGASLIRFSSRRPLCARKGPYAPRLS